MAASVGGDAEHGTGLLAGFATFLAVVLHKPFDAGIIATLMINAGIAPATRRLVNAAYAADWQAFQRDGEIAASRGR